MLPVNYIADVSIFDEMGLYPFNIFGRNVNIIVPGDAVQVMRKEHNNNLNYIRVLSYIDNPTPFTCFGDRCGCRIVPGSTLQIAARLENDSSIGSGHPVILAGHSQLKRLREATSELRLEVIGLLPPAIWSGYIKRSAVQSHNESKIRLVIRASYNTTAARFVTVTHTGRHDMRRLTFYGGDATKHCYSDVHDIEAVITQEYLDNYGVEVLFIGCRPNSGNYAKAHTLTMSWLKAKYDIVGAAQPNQLQFQPLRNFFAQADDATNIALVVEHAEQLNYAEAIAAANLIDDAPASSKIVLLYTMKDDIYESAVEQLSRDIAIESNVAVVTPYISGKSYMRHCTGR